MSGAQRQLPFPVTASIGCSFRKIKKLWGTLQTIDHLDFGWVCRVNDNTSKTNNARPKLEDYLRRRTTCAFCILDYVWNISRKSKTGSSMFLSIVVWLLLFLNWKCCVLPIVLILWDWRAESRNSFGAAESIEVIFSKYNTKMKPAYLGWY